MVAWFGKRRCSPIGIDIGSRSVKLLQFDAERARVREASRWEFSGAATGQPPPCDDQVVQAIQRAREGRNFCGKEAVFCLGAADLFVQNLRVPPSTGVELTRNVWNEAVGRLPFTREEAEIRFLEAADVRQGETLRREVIVLACRRPAVQRYLGIADRLGLRLTAIDVEPNAVLRCYAAQYRREDDQQKPQMFVSLGAATTSVVIARGEIAMFVKYIDVGGRQMDESVARQLQMSLPEALALRRYNGDRRADQRDPEVARSVAESVRPVVDRLGNELSLCIRYFSVTFRGQPLSRIVLGGGEATAPLAEWLAERLSVPCELGNPLRSYPSPPISGCCGQWDVAAGLALREVK
jgi:type IV pilus assembly protein PilM